MNFDLIPSLLSTSTNFVHWVVFPLRSQPSKTISAPLDKTRAIFVVVSAVSVAELPRKQGNVSSLDDSLFHIPTGSPTWNVKQSTAKTGFMCGVPDRRGEGRGHLLCGGPYRGCAATKGYFLSPDSLAKGLSPDSLAKGILTKIP